MSIDNKSGLYPVEYKVLVKPDKIEEKTAGGIILPESVMEQERLGVAKMTMIAHGGNCFEDWIDQIPVDGSRVVVDKYAGKYMVGDDGEDYRLINDKDIIAITN